VLLYRQLPKALKGLSEQKLDGARTLLNVLVPSALAVQATETAKMPKRRKEKDASDIKLRQPDRSGPSEKTLLEIAQQRKLFQEADARQRQLSARTSKGGESEEEEDEEGAGISPRAERILETMLWSVSLAMLHYTLDVLVQHQYAIAINWWELASRAAQAFLGMQHLVPPRTRMTHGTAHTHALPVFSLLFYALHRHASDPTVVPGLPDRYQPALRQAVFAATSVAAGCYLIYVSNRHGYLAVMRRAPPLATLWIWSVMELELPLAVLALACAGGYAWQGGYGVK
jgi:hypothetical protein